MLARSPNTKCHPGSVVMSLRNLTFGEVIIKYS